MLSEIGNPVATARMRWIPAEEGGRASGPPTAAVYASTTTFRTGDPVEQDAGWPATDPRTTSVLLQRVEPEPHEVERSKVGFLAPEQARPYLREGAELVVLEGPKPVAEAVITEVLRTGEDT
ncbi:hypothetical protein [Saccharomonospora iraqiensis]|uniref:hypothetical protein n=1 Tax=Saccharomonospora iraqiensis TaxID=52698 RepID=UPI00022E201D|nr:hypothetical protein [Saccharomonospora iraqiensis]